MSCQILHNPPFTLSDHNSYSNPLNQPPKTYTWMILMVKFYLIPLYTHYLRSHCSITHTLGLSALKTLPSHPTLSNKTILEQRFSSMGVIVKTEPTGKKFWRGIHKQELLQKAQWLEFVEKFDGFHREVIKSFTKAFDGVEVEIGTSNSEWQSHL